MLVKVGGEVAELMTALENDRSVTVDMQRHGERALGAVRSIMGSGDTKGEMQPL